MPQFSHISRRVRQTGAVLGFLTGLAIVAWIGFGGPKPPPPTLPVSAANCSTPGDTGQVVTRHPMTSDMSQDTPEYFYLYRISYAWTSAIGFMVTVLMGIMAGGFRRGHTDKSNIDMCVSGEAERLLHSAEAEVDSNLLASCVRPRSRELREQLRLEHKAVC